MIEFRDRDGALGYVRNDDGKLVVSTPTVQIYVDTWGDRPAEMFERYYEGWSNGYVGALSVPDHDFTPITPAAR